MNLVDGVIKGMLMSKLKTSIAALCVTAVVGVIAVALAHQASAARPVEPAIQIQFPDSNNTGAVPAVVHRSGPPRLQVEHKSPVSCLAWSPNGTMLAAGTQDGTIQLTKAATGKEIRSFATGGAVTALAFSPDGKSLVIGHAGSRINLWDVGTGKQEGNNLPLNVPVTHLAFTSDGRAIIGVGVGQYFQCDLGGGRGGMGMAGGGGGGGGGGSRRW
jgi:DNA-binding beta-propeller fold protein YncE